MEKKTVKLGIRNSNHSRTPSMPPIVLVSQHTLSHMLILMAAMGERKYHAHFTCKAQMTNNSLRFTQVIRGKIGLQIQIPVTSKFFSLK